MADDVSVRRLDEYAVLAAKLSLALMPNSGSAGGKTVRPWASPGMARCFLTGVEFPLQKAFVLNRRGARDLLNALKDRVAALQRVIDHFSPLDEHKPHEHKAKLFGRENKRTVIPKRHRLVCKAVADALAPGFPEITLFENWPDYRSRARRIATHGVVDGLIPSVVMPPPEAKEAPEPEPNGQDHETGRQS